MEICCSNSQTSNLIFMCFHLWFFFSCFLLHGVYGTSTILWWFCTKIILIIMLFLCSAKNTSFFFSSLKQSFLTCKHFFNLFEIIIRHGWLGGMSSFIYLLHYNFGLQICIVKKKKMYLYNHFKHLIISSPTNPLNPCMTVRKEIINIK